MKYSATLKFLTVGVLALVILSNSAFADDESQSIRDLYEEATSVTPAVMPTQGSGYAEPTKISYDDENPAPLVPEEERHFDHNAAIKGSPHRRKKKVEKEAEVEDENLPPISIDSLKRSLEELYKDSSSVWENLMRRAGEKWDQATNSYKRDSADTDEAMAYSAFFNIAKSLREYRDTLNKNIQDTNEETQKKLSQVYNRLSNTYREVKETTQKKIEGVLKSAGADDTLESAKARAEDVYQGILKKFYKTKETLDSYIKTFTDEAERTANKGIASYEILKDTSRELYRNSTDSWKEIKKMIGGHINKANSDFIKRVYSTWETVNKDMEGMKVFFYKNFTVLSDDARALFHQQLAELNTRYQNLRSQAEKFAEDVTKGLENPGKTFQDAYETSYQEYRALRDRIQYEFDYFNGKITKKAYEAATGVKREWERITALATKVLKQTGDASEEVKEETFKILQPIWMKVREFFEDSSKTYLELDSKVFAYWDATTGLLKNVNDKAVKTVRETMQNSIGEFQQLEHFLGMLVEGYAGEVSDTFKNAITDLEEKYIKLKDYTKRKYLAWTRGDAGSSETQKGYDEAREAYMASKEHLHVELYKFFEDAENPHILHRDELQV